MTWEFHNQVYSNLENFFNVPCIFSNTTNCWYSCNLNLIAKFGNPFSYPFLSPGELFVISYKAKLTIFFWFFKFLRNKIYQSRSSSFKPKFIRIIFKFVCNWIKKGYPETKSCIGLVYYIRKRFWILFFNFEVYLTTLFGTHIKFYKQRL